VSDSLECCTYSSWYLSVEGGRKKKKQKQGSAKKEEKEVKKVKG
jgi:hypothetical protein